MQRAGGGYTIIEVLIVLAISMVLFFIAIGLFAGKSNSVQFTQATQDLASKIQVWTNQVTTGVHPDLSHFGATPLYCLPSSGSNRVYLTYFDNGPGNCVYLGRALYLNSLPGSSAITAYGVIGDQYINGIKSNGIVQTYDQAKPTTTRACIGASCDISDIDKDPYNLLNGLQIISSKINGNPGFGLVGLYTDFGGTSSPDVSGSTSLLTKAYPFTGADTSVQYCVEENSSYCPTNSVVTNFSQWQLCVQYGGGGPTALIKVTPTAGSLTSQIIYQACS